MRLFHHSKTLSLLYLTQKLIQACSVRVQMQDRGAEVAKDFVSDAF